MWGYSHDCCIFLLFLCLFWDFWKNRTKCKMLNFLQKCNSASEHKYTREFPIPFFFCSYITLSFNFLISYCHTFSSWVAFSIESLYGCLSLWMDNYRMLYRILQRNFSRFLLQRKWGRSSLQIVVQKLTILRFVLHF